MEQKKDRAAEQVSLQFMKVCYPYLSHCACLISKVLLQLPLTDTPLLLSYTSTVTSSPRSTFNLLKSRCKCPNISSEAVHSPLGGAATGYEYHFMTVLTPLSHQSVPQGGMSCPLSFPMPGLMLMQPQLKAQVLPRFFSWASSKPDQ